jgi:putative ATPase
MNASLFGEDAPRESEPHRDAPLAERMRPRNLSEYCGQAKLVAPGGLLERMLRTGLRQSLILWGPPGVGKTSLARILARESGLAFAPFSAVLSGIKEVREFMQAAEQRRRAGGASTLVFIDEIHRFNKAQQDAFLPFIERGDVLLVGATTENPSFELVSPLLSRARVLVLEPLASEDLVGLLRRALADEERGLAGALRADEPALRAIASASDGDARRALSILETAALLAQAERETELGPALLAQALQRKSVRYDKSGEQHYDLASALHKSVRNCDENASLYWLVRMLEGGEDRVYLGRRLVRMAVEDVGLADPRALGVALEALAAWRLLGSPEGELALAQAAVYLARAPKSNALYTAYASAREDVEASAAEPVPLHLRNAPTALLGELGHGRGYRYLHDDPAAREEMRCMPPGLEGRRYFGPPPPPSGPST